MAISTTTTINDTVTAAIIDPVGQDYAHDWTVISPLCKQYSLVGKGSNVYQIWRFASAMGTVGAAGAGVDTEFDGAQATDQSSTTLSSDQVQITLAEYAVMRELSDFVFEDSVSGIDFVSLVMQDAARILMTAFEDDLAALLGDFSNTAGSTGVNLSAANMSAALVGIRNRGVRAPDNCVFILDEQAASDFEDNIISGENATDNRVPLFALGADRMLRVTPDGVNGLANGLIGSFRGCGVYQTGLTDTANTAADVESACFVHDTPANGPFAALGIVTGRPFRLETERNASARSTEFVASMRLGSAELSDVSGTTLITDA